MMSGSSIHPGLISAYRETHYRVFTTPAFRLQIDVPSAELAALHREHGVNCSAFVTAWNPFSRSHDDASNSARQDELRDGLRRQGREFVEGVGVHPSGGWPGEPSLLVLGLTLQDAEALGKRLEQNAIVWCDADARPRLILLR
jgi:hypothetical protein